MFFKVNYWKLINWKVSGLYAIACKFFFFFGFVCGSCPGQTSWFFACGAHLFLLPLMHTSQYMLNLTHILTSLIIVHVSRRKNALALKMQHTFMPAAYFSFVLEDFAFLDLVAFFLTKAKSLYILYKTQPWWAWKVSFKNFLKIVQTLS